MLSQLSYTELRVLEIETHEFLQYDFNKIKWCSVRTDGRLVTQNAT